MQHSGAYPLSTRHRERTTHPSGPAMNGGCALPQGLHWFVTCRNTISGSRQGNPVLTNALDVARAHPRDFAVKRDAPAAFQLTRNFLMSPTRQALSSQPDSTRELTCSRYAI